MFSVVVPLYNKEISVQNTIQSVLTQKFKEFELIIVNDGSTDNSLEVVKQIQDPRIRIIDKPNGGVSSARNKGIEEAKFEWIAFLDADDLWENNHLTEVKRMINQYPNEKLFATSFKYSDGRIMKKLNRDSDIYLVSNYFKDILDEYLVWTGILVANKSSLIDAGLFNVKLSRGEDLDLWERLARRNNIVKSKIVTSTYRIDAENRSDQKFNLEKSRIYYYNFSDAASKEEILYYRNFIIRVMRGLLRKRDFKSFFKLKQKHNPYIRYIDILKK